ncbi:uncharacterized protein LTR77_009653 [Saxophila tyrrhenica]|uniref:Uncharacterized protein n=1 Tax=Saxophila tyrrhenica TaxID=1690608 RepID=A0AAV9NYK6_9PEZI|nr:hypothetical protein LTR77_009653 [Saxophila tyrrhenica]
MPPRIRLQTSSLTPLVTPSTGYICLACRHASLATATTPAPPLEQTTSSTPPIQRYPRNQPPSHKPPEFRKTQLHRQYQSLLRSAPLMLIFQHNNLKSTEWMALRRELATALRKVDADLAAQDKHDLLAADGIKLQVIQTGIFASALRVVEFWNPDFSSSSKPHTPIHPTDPSTPTSEPIITSTAQTTDPSFTHGLSAHAALTAKKSSRRSKHGLEPLLSGPLALLTFPTVTPQHLKAALSILSPSPPNFPAPRRKANPSYHEPAVQNGLQKLLLLAARVEGKVFDQEGTRWVGGIEGGLEGLRGQLVAMLSGVGAGVTGTLEAAGRSLYVTVEGRRGMMEEEEKGGKEGEQ